jgi:hypothetical protein
MILVPLISFGIGALLGGLGLRQRLSPWLSRIAPFPALVSRLKLPRKESARMFWL